MNNGSEFGSNKKDVKSLLTSDSFNKDMRGNASKGKRRNIETNIISFIFLGVFLAMIGYSALFTYNDSITLASSPYNPRNIEEAAPPLRRGTIYASDGTELAKTQIDEDGNEKREYPTNNLFSLIVGMSRGGGSGLEGAMNTELTTSSSREQVDVTTNDKTITQYLGDSIYTTLDAELQQAAYDALGDYSGAIVAVNPTTGEVLASVSKPDYNPNEAGSMYNTWASYSSEDSVLVNRATQGLYAPGSVFKILTALEYVKENPDTYGDFTFNCTGSTSEPGGTVINCYHRTSHGREDLGTALVNSCNCAFSHMGVMLNMQYYRNTAESIGMNSKLPIEVESSVSKFPLTTSSSVAEKQQTAYGQGDLMMTPLQVCMMTSVIANDGVLMKPYLVDRIVDSKGNVVKQNAPSVYKNGVATAEEAQIIGGYMRDVVKGTASNIFGNLSYEVAGKTGTAEYANNSSYSHLWFTCYAPYDDPKIAITCVIEKSSQTSVLPQRLVRPVLQAYLGR